MEKDHHRILGVPADANLAAIKLAYRRLARRYHPDVSTEASASERFAEITEAYRVLSAQQILKENRYKIQNSASAMRKNADRTERRKTARDAADAGRKPQETADDCELAVHLSVEELYWGTELKIDPATQCPGHRFSPRESGRRQLMRVKVPRGIQRGQRLHIKASDRRAPEGAIYLTINLKPHDRYDVIDNTLYVDLPLSPHETLHGAIVDVVTPGGRIDIDVPAGISSGQSIRIPHRGLPKSPEEYGDLFAVVRIVNIAERTRNLHRWPNVSHRDVKHWAPVGGYKAGGNVNVMV